jgi:hypothetical protein
MRFDMVYVNPLQGLQYPVEGQWPFVRYCELFADTREELERFARDRLNISRSAWVTVKHCIPCYYLPVFQRKRAIEAGAKELTKHQTVDWMRRYIARSGDPLAR